MAKIELKKVLEEGLKEAAKKEEARQLMKVYEKKMDDSLARLKAMMRRDGYNV